MSGITAIGQRVCLEGLAREMSKGSLEVLDVLDQVLLRFKMSAAFSYDPVEQTAKFAPPQQATVEKMGKPVKYRIVSGSLGGASLYEGSAGAPEESPNLVLAKQLYMGMKVTLKDAIQVRMNIIRPTGA